jgi:hypothetical protein
MDRKIVANIKTSLFLLAIALFLGGCSQPPPIPKISIAAREKGKTVLVNDIVKTAKISEDLDLGNGIVAKKLTLVDTGEYNIVYFSAQSRFIIELTSKDIVKARTNAENSLLSILGIEKNGEDTEACKLWVAQNVPLTVNAAAVGVDYRLSFCADGRPFSIAALALIPKLEPIIEIRRQPEPPPPPSRGLGG